MTQLNVRVEKLRPLFVPPDPMSGTEYVPGQLALGSVVPEVDIPLRFGQVGRPR